MTNHEVDIVDLMLHLEIVSEEYPSSENRSQYLALIEQLTNIAPVQLNEIRGQLSQPMRTILDEALEELAMSTPDSEIDRSKKFRKTCGVGGCR